VRTGESVAAGAAVSIILIVKQKARMRQRGKIPVINPVLQRGVGRGNGHETVSTALHANEKSQDWVLWQLADSAFPTGSFAHSNGLEAAWQHGEVRNRAELISFIEAGLQQLSHAALPFVTAAFDEPEKLGELDRLCDVFTTNHVANRASRSQGRAMLSAVERIFKAESGKRKAEKKLLFAHFAPVFGSCLRHLDVPREMAARLFFFSQLRGVLAAAVRLNIVGPMEAQILQQRLAPQAEKILNHCASLTLGDLAQTAPLLDLWQGAQDRLYSRLFQS
jgi:urease accessory protein